MKRRSAAELGGNSESFRLVLDGFYVPDKLSYGAVASLFEARGTAGPPIYCDLST